MTLESSHSKDSPDDASLIDAIAQRRDREAFAILFQRHEQPIYNLARRITSRQDLAEEVLQETMLAVWRSASSLRDHSSVKGWILGIAARSSFSVLRGRKQERKAMTRERTAPKEEPVAPTESLERGELFVAMRKLLEGLPELERQLVASAYGGGLSHEEISTAVGLPKSTVTSKIRRALDSLRSQLSRAGFTATATWLERDGLSEAICSGYAPPSGLGEKVLAQISRAGRTSVKAGHVVAAGGGATKIGAFVFAILSVCGIAVWLAGAPGGKTSGEGSISASQAPAKSGNYFWDFNESLPEEFKKRPPRFPRQDWPERALEWGPRQGKGETGGVSCGEQTSSLVIPALVPLDRLPVYISFDFQAVGKDCHFSVGVVFTDEVKTQTFTPMGNDNDYSVRWHRDTWVPGVSSLEVHGNQVEFNYHISGSGGIGSSCPLDTWRTSTRGKTAYFVLNGRSCRFDNLRIEYGTPRENLLPRTWNFNSPELPRAFRVMKGSWRHVPDGGPDGSGCIETDTRSLNFMLDLPLRNATYLLSARIKNLDKPPIYAGCAWNESDSRAVLSGIGKPMDSPPHSWLTVHNYVTVDFVDRWVQVGEKRQRTSFFIGRRKGFSPLRFGVTSGRCRIDDLSIREIPAKEIPDSRHIRDACESIPEEKRIGKVTLPQIESPVQGQRVYINFLSSTPGATKIRKD